MIIVRILILRLSSLFLEFNNVTFCLEKLLFKIDILIDQLFISLPDGD